MSSLFILFIFYSAYFDLPPNLLLSICYVETQHNVHAINSNDGGSQSLGVCQIKLSTARWLGFKGTSSQLISPSINIYYAAKYLHYQFHRYENVSKAIIGYNQGSTKNLTDTKYSSKVKKYWLLFSNEHPQLIQNFTKKEQNERLFIYTQP